jgi:hypothetical protein
MTETKVLHANEVQCTKESRIFHDTTVDSDWQNLNYLMMELKLCMTEPNYICMIELKIRGKVRQKSGGRVVVPYIVDTQGN